MLEKNLYLNGCLIKCILNYITRVLAMKNFVHASCVVLAPNHSKQLKRITIVDWRAFRYIFLNERNFIIVSKYQNEVWKSQCKSSFTDIRI